MRILNTIPKTVVIDRVIEESELVKLFVFKHSVGAQPGQFVNVWIPRMDEKPFFRGFGYGEELHLTIAAVGPGFQGDSCFGQGDKLGIRGPLGRFFQAQPGQHLAFWLGLWSCTFVLFAHEAVKQDAPLILL